jgi:hypothetical protein
MARQKPPGGTMEYTAPEIAPEFESGQRELRPQTKMVYWDHSADYWSLGATIFHVQTGQVRIICSFLFPSSSFTVLSIY